MCISGLMADEYFRRYGKTFSVFRNPIEISQWIHFQKGRIVSSDSLKIVYTGRTYPPYFDTLIDICRVIDNLNRKDINVSIEISSIEINPSFLKKIENLKGVSFYKPVNINEIPHLISQYDIFLICEDFNKDAQRYLHYSLSTRASEGMISGVPVLLYAPEESALCKYFRDTDSGCIVGTQDTAKLEESIIRLWNDPDYRQQISSNAIRSAMRDSDSIVVREEFRKALTIVPEK
jgi:glycosyltransferase involved in cell wall biosynthesis